MKRTQAQRVLAFIEANPGCTTMDIQLGLSPFVSNPRARISDLRIAGHVIDCDKDRDGIARYHARPATPGVARFSASDSKVQVERKMAEAFAPVEAAMDAWRRVFGGDA